MNCLVTEDSLRHAAQQELLAFLTSVISYVARSQPADEYSDLDLNALYATFISLPVDQTSALDITTRNLFLYICLYSFNEIYSLAHAAVHGDPLDLTAFSSAIVENDIAKNLSANFDPTNRELIAIRNNLALLENYGILVRARVHRSEFGIAGGGYAHTCYLSNPFLTDFYSHVKAARA